jgi:hypothetical protein
MMMYRISPGCEINLDSVHAILRDRKTGVVTVIFRELATCPERELCLEGISEEQHKLALRSLAKRIKTRT